MKYRIRDKKIEGTNLTRYTLERYIVRRPKPFGLVLLGVWMPFASTTNYSRSEQWRKQYNVCV